MAEIERVVMEAFHVDSPPDADNIVLQCEYDDPERQEYVEAFAGKEWTALDMEFLRRNESALSAFTPDAFV